MGKAPCYATGYKNFLAVVKQKPWVVKMTFSDKENKSVEYIHLFEG